jgi:hypothetical protein
MINDRRITDILSHKHTEIDLTKVVHSNMFSVSSKVIDETDSIRNPIFFDIAPVINNFIDRIYQKKD